MLFRSFDDRYLGSKSSAPTLDNDGNALINGALYWNSTSQQMFVRDSSSWVVIKPTTTEQNNINTVAGISSNITTVSGANSNITTVAGQITPTNNIGTVASNSTNISTVAGISGNVTTVAGISGNITTVAGANTNITAVAGQISPTNNIQTVANSSADIGTVATNITNVNSVASNISNVNTVATNVASVNSFANIYRISSTAPTTSLDTGDLWFDTTAAKLKIWNGSSWDLAGSSINGTSARFIYTATSGQTTFSGADSNGNTLAYDSGFIDVYLNGIRLNPADYTATNGSSIVLTTGAATGDILYIVGFGTFSVANFNASGLTGTINIARIADGSITNAKLQNSSITINGRDRKSTRLNSSHT